jgi:ribose-phosphate pyrophosphokinase
MDRRAPETVVLALPGAATLADGLASALGLVRGAAEVRPFPDGETYVRIDTPVEARDVAIAATLRDPDTRLVALHLLAATARDLGAARVGLVAPYLPYLRQDARFRPGEGVTSRYVGEWLSRTVDWVVTVDPHLHRTPDLGALYRVPATVVGAAPAIAAWIRSHVDRPLLVGPDGESRQWVETVAGGVGAPCVVLSKRRHADRRVEVVVPDVERWVGHTPVLVDDIISTAVTMAETVRQLRAAGLRAPVCIGVHAVFADGAEAALAAAGAAAVVTCDTLPHATNRIAVLPLVADGVRRHC